MFGVGRVACRSVSSDRSQSSSNNAHDLGEKLPIRMLHDRVLVRQDAAEGERRSGGGILIPATAQVGKRLAWAEVVAVGQNVRTVEPGDRVLYDPEERAELVFGEADVLLLPSAPGAAPAGLSATGDPRFNRLWTLMGVPAINVPGLHASGGLPLGAQVIAPFGRDRLGLAVADWLERVIHRA